MIENFKTNIKKEIVKCNITNGFPCKHSTLYYLYVDNINKKSLIEYNKMTKNLWVSDTLTKQFREDFEPIKYESFHPNEHSQCSDKLKEIFSEVLNIKVKNFYDVDLVNIVGF